MSTSLVAQKLLLPFEMRKTLGCLVCGEQFYAHERKAFENHVVACAVVNEDAVMAMSTKERMKDILAVGDHELDEWVKNHRSEILEGRKRY